MHGTFDTIYISITDYNLSANSYKFIFLASTKNFEVPPLSVTPTHTVNLFTHPFLIYIYILVLYIYIYNGL